MKNNLFPIFLKTEHLRFLIVGGGNVGLEKVSTLIKQNPSVNLKVVAKEFKQELKDVFLQYPSIQHETHAFESSDLEDVDLVIVATDNNETSREVKQKANAKGILVNAADQPDLCDFYLGSIVNKGHLKIAISTNGQSPVMAKRLREYFSDVIPDSIDENIESLNKIRNNHKGDFNQKLTDLNHLTSSFEGKKSTKKYKRLVTEITLIFFALFLGYALSSIVSFSEAKDFVIHIPNVFLHYVGCWFFRSNGRRSRWFGIWCNLFYKHDVVWR